MPSPNASRRNLEKAHARWRPPRPWRSEQETHLIKRIVARWLLHRRSQCSGRELAKRLCVSQAYLWKLSQKLSAEPAATVQLVRGPDRLPYELLGMSADGRFHRVQYLSASWELLFAQLSDAREQTQKMRKSGCLRGRSSASPWAR